jgi:hypothetical protein
MQQNFSPSFAVFPFGVFYFYMASSVDTRNKYPGRRGDVTYVAGMVASSTDHGIARISEIFGNFRRPFYQFFGKSDVGRTPRLIDSSRTTPLFGDSFEIFFHVLSCPDSQIVIPGTNIHGEMDLVTDNVPVIGKIVNFSDTPPYFRPFWRAIHSQKYYLFCASSQRFCGSRILCRCSYFFNQLPLI